MAPKKQLGQLLVEENVVDEHQLQSALGTQKQWGGKLGTILVQKGFCKEVDVIRVLAKHLGMAVVDLHQVKVDPRAVMLLSRQTSERYHVLAYEITGSGRLETVTVAMNEPTDLSVVDQLAFATGKRIKPMLCGSSELTAAIALHYANPSHPVPAPAPSALAAGGQPGVSGPPATGRVAPVSRGGPSRRPPLPPLPPPVMMPIATAALRSASQPPLSPVRISPTGGAPSVRASPYIPPPIPVRVAPPQSAPLDEIEPMDLESLPGVEALPSPLPEGLRGPGGDAPPARGASDQIEGLEPIAASTEPSAELTALPGLPLDEADSAPGAFELDSAAPGHEVAAAPTASESDWEQAIAQVPHAVAPLPDTWLAVAPQVATPDLQAAPVPEIATPRAESPFGEARDWSHEPEAAHTPQAETQPAAPIVPAAPVAVAPVAVAPVIPAVALELEEPVAEELPMDAILGEAQEFLPLPPEPVLESAPVAEAMAEPKQAEAPVEAAAFAEPQEAAQPAFEQPSFDEPDPATPTAQPLAEAPSPWGAVEDPLAVAPLEVAELWASAAHEVEGATTHEAFVAEPLTEDFAAAEEPVAAEELAAAEEPVATEELAAAEEPVATEEFAAAEEPVATEDLAAAEEPVATEEFAAAEEPVATEDLAAAEEPVATEDLAAAEEPVATEELAAAEEPVATEEFAAAEEPVAAEELAAAEEPVATEEFAAAEEPVATEEFAAAEEPATEEAATAEGIPAGEEAPAEWGAVSEPSAEIAPAEQPAAEEQPASAEQSGAEEQVAEGVEQAASPESPAAAEVAGDDFASEPSTGAEASEDVGIADWVPPPPEPQSEGAGWIGQALAATQVLSQGDRETLAAVGIDPADGSGALRLLCGLLRVLQQRQLLDLGELAAEVATTQAAVEAPVAEDAAEFAEAPVGSADVADSEPPSDPFAS